MKRSIMTTILLVAHAAFGQSAGPTQERTPPTIRSVSTLVTVPTLVRLSSGDFVKHLHAGHFQLFDNGIMQKISVEETENQPIALVVLMQTGGAAPLQFQSYRNLPNAVDSIIGDSAHEIMLITFDSRVEQLWHFPSRFEGVMYAVTHPIAGDDGAAIMDAVNAAIDMLQQEPGNFRRVVLLLSQQEDDGSKTSVGEIVRNVGEGSTVIYAVTFSAPKLRPSFRSKEPTSNAPSRSTRDATLSPTPDTTTPLGVALNAMRKNTAAEIAALSGGEHHKFRDGRDFERQLSIVADEIHNCYTLTFQPNSAEPGFHTLRLEVAGQGKRLDIANRTSYWLAARPEQNAH